MHRFQNVRWAALIFLLLAFAQIGRAQISWYGGSAYDNIGFGLPTRSGNAVTDALGGTGVALNGSRIVNELNPADWTWITQARFGVSLSYDYVNAAQGPSQDVQQNVQFGGGTFAAPIYEPLNAVIAVGYLPITDANNETVVNDSLGARTYYSRGGTISYLPALRRDRFPRLQLERGSIS